MWFRANDARRISHGDSALRVAGIELERYTFKDMKKTFEQFVQELLDGIGNATRLVIAIDGFGGSGKSTFAQRLREKIPAAGIVSIDHFYQPITPDGENEFHWVRFEKETIDAFRNDREICYQPYDWKLKAFQNAIEIGRDQHVIVEGVYSTQEKFCDAYDVTIWIDTPDSVRLQRGIARDGESMRPMWENVWIPYTRKYMEEHRPHLSVDIVIDGVESDVDADEVVVKDVREE